MFYLECTQATLKRLKLSTDHVADAQPNPSVFGNFYAHYFAIEHRNAVVFMSEHTLLSFILLEGQIKIAPDNLPLMLVHGLEQLLRFRNYPKQEIDPIIDSFQIGLFSSTKNRSDVGYLNTIVSDYLFLTDCHGGLGRCDLTAIIMHINEIPRPKLDNASPWAATASRMALHKSAAHSKPRPKH